MVKTRNERAFTLIETLAVITILIAIISAAAPSYKRFSASADLGNSAENMLNILRLARSKTLASEQNDKWGVHFSSPLASPYEYVLFKGEDYPGRETSFDQEFALPDTVEVFSTDMGTSSEIIFNRLTGTAGNPGTISLRLASDHSKTKNIVVETSGQVLFQESMPNDNNRIKDSRHVHLSYSRTIDAVAEDLTLTFTGTPMVVKTISIGNNMQSGQFFWEGEVEVDGIVQALQIQTLAFNDPVLDTLFCIYRDRQHNNTDLEISLSDDSTGSLINYDNDGQTSQGNSIYVSEPVWQ